MRVPMRPVLIAAAAIAAFAAFGSPAMAQPDLAGHWAGYGRSAGINPGPPGVWSFDVFTVDHRRFTSAVKWPADPECFPSRGPSRKAAC